MLSLHIIRPWFLIGLLGVVILALLSKKPQFMLRSWKEVCDKPLLEALSKQASLSVSTRASLWPLLCSLTFMIIAASGPAWQKLPTPSYTQDIPKLILFDISPNMLAADLQPNRFQRGLFVLHDLLSEPNISPIGLIAYTQEPFMVSPITQDAKTIQALLPSLSPDIAPVGGQNLAAALEEALIFFQQAHFQCGAMLVLTGNPPNTAAIDTAKKLQRKGCQISILPLTAYQGTLPDFQAFAQAGQGEILSLTNLHLNQWLKNVIAHAYHMKVARHHTPLWKDEGRWFLVLALLSLMPIFRRGWLRRLS